MFDTETVANIDSLNDALTLLQKSARRTVPMFFVGILATLLAAGIALYYILTLSADLREARRALEQSQAALTQARTNLAVAGDSLRQAQKTGPSSADAGTIATAISDVSRSQRDLTIASSSLTEATAKLATAAPERQAANGSVSQLSGAWFAVVGSYSTDEAGMAKAKDQLAAMQAAGLCGELWQTQISHNLAVVLGGMSDRKTAATNVGRARKAGVAKDAFAQADRSWTQSPASPHCACTPDSC